MQSRKLLSFALLSLAVVASACSDSTSPQTLVGVYTLTTINSSAPPAVVASDVTGTVEVTGGRVTLNTDMTFSDAADLRFTDASTGQVTTTQDIATGTYSVSGNTITFSPTGDTAYSMVANGSTLTQVATGLTFVYQR